MKVSKTDIDISLSTYKIIIDADLNETEKEIRLLKTIEKEKGISELPLIYRNNIISLYLPLLLMRKSICLDLLESFEYVKKKYHELFSNNEIIDSSMIDDFEKELSKLNTLISDLKYKANSNDCFDKTDIDKTISYYEQKSVSISKGMVSIYELPVVDKESINYFDQVYGKIVVYRNIIRNYENEERIFEKKINELCNSDDIKSLVVSINNSFAVDNNVLNDGLSNVLDFVNNIN